ncbi:MAG: hypothetical protein ACOX6Z_01695 [Dethiobacteria bacterium]|jgi:hypothetical protein
MKLVILLIVLKILSSLFQNLRGGGRQPFPSKGPARPRPAGRPLPPDIFDFPPLPEMPAEPVAEGEGKPDRGIGSDLPGQPLFQGDAVSAVQARSFSPAPALSQSKAVSPRAVRPQKTARPHQKRELAKLLKGENLPLGLIASEVLSPPRARRSFYTSRAGK